MLSRLTCKIFFAKSPADRIAYDRRVIWNIEDIIKEFGGHPVPTAIDIRISKLPCVVMVQYTEERCPTITISDFAFCDSGMIIFYLLRRFYLVRSKIYQI